MINHKAITATFYGKWVTYPRYNIPAICVDDKMLFSIYDDNYIKFVQTDNNYNIIVCKYTEKKILLSDTTHIIDEFKICTNIIPKGYYYVTDFKVFDQFPPLNCLEDNVIFTIWFGKSYTKNRDSQFKSILRTSRCNVININENNLHLLSYPIHKSFHYLSSIHKADYLRCYLMYYYGGGYSDLKATSGSWLLCFEELKNNNELFAIGYNCDGLPSDYNIDLYNKLQKNFNKLIGVGFFIFKKNTSIVIEWFEILNQRLDAYYEDLKKFPAIYDRESKSGTPVPIWEGGKSNTNYPISWNNILGHILYPIQLNYLKNIKLGIPHRADRGNYK